MKFIPYIMMVVFLALIALSVIYLSRKVIFIFGIEKTALVYTAISLLPVFMILATGFFINATSSMGHILYKISAVTMGIYLFSVFSFLILDAVNMFYKFSPINYGLIGFGLAAIITIYGYWNGANIRTTPVTIKINGLKSEVKAVHLSDVHIGHFRLNGFLQEMIDKTNEQNPDVVFLTGDYLDSKYALNIEHFEPLKQIKAPIYFVDGNHDHATNTDSIMKLMRAVGVNTLDNEKTVFGELQIVGLTHMLADRNSFDVHANGHAPTIAETLPKLEISKDQPTVLLHHAPNGIKYANDHGIDLYLAGHTHAGQIWPFSFIANMMFDFNRGLHKHEETNLYVSEGVGTFGPPFRLGTKSEIIVFDLIPN